MLSDRTHTARQIGELEQRRERFLCKIEKMLIEARRRQVHYLTAVPTFEDGIDPELFN